MFLNDNVGNTGVSKVLRKLFESLTKTLKKRGKMQMCV